MVEALKSKEFSSVGAAGFCWGGEFIHILISYFVMGVSFIGLFVESFRILTMHIEEITPHTATISLNPHRKLKLLVADSEISC